MRHLSFDTGNQSTTTAHSAAISSLLRQLQNLFGVDHCPLYAAYSRAPAGLWGNATSSDVSKEQKALLSCRLRCLIADLTKACEASFAKEVLHLP
jgi:hypothetical protein